MLLTNGKIWINDNLVEGNIYIDSDKGIITKITKQTKPTTKDETIDLKGKIVIPGLVDIHCHLRDFGESHKENYESGATAAAAGGYTTVFDMPNKKPPVISSKELTQAYEKTRNLKTQIISYMLLSKESEKPLVYTYPFVKAYLGLTTGHNLISLKELDDFFKKGSNFLSVHCDIKEDEDSQAEFLAIQKVVDHFKKVNSKVKLHIAHVTSPQAVEMLIKEKISFEVTPHHLLLDNEMGLGIWGRMLPPLRSKEIRNKMFQLFLKGHIPVIATDHAPHLKSEKETGSYGVPNLDTALATILNAMQPITTQKLKLIINSMSINPRKLMKGLPSGLIAENKRANLCIIDINLEKKITKEILSTKCQWSPWEGKIMKGWPVLTIKDGKIV